MLRCGGTKEAVVKLYRYTLLDATVGAMRLLLLFALHLFRKQNIIIWKNKHIC